MEKELCLSMYIANSEDRKMVKRGAEKSLQYEDPTKVVRCMWGVNREATYV
jgi:hypothetical protein